jgi:hypothetical protein
MESEIINGLEGYINIDTHIYTHITTEPVRQQYIYKKTTFDFWKQQATKNIKPKKEQIKK